jgi:tetratricopeptide (TPR) repeat protein
MSTVEAELEAIQRLYDQGTYLQAHTAAEAAGMYADPSPEAQILASRLIANLGAQRRAYAMSLRTLRRFPNHATGRYFATYALLRRRGPWEALEAWSEFGLPDPDNAILTADWWALKGLLSAYLRDFEAADRALDEAEAAAPSHPWVFVQRSEVLSLEDRHEEGLDAVRRALELRPFYRPAVQAIAQSLEGLNRADEAIELLTEACLHLESGDVRFHLASMLCDSERFDEARAHLDQVPRFWPMADKDHGEALAARLSYCAYRCGDEATAVEQARRSKSKFHEQTADNLAAARPEDRRVLLDVPFVRQHHVTCAPATLTAIAGYWKRPVDHLEVAEKICYDGTPSHSERGWAEQSGYVTREFAVDLATTKALVDRGVPFTFTTVEPTSSHLQAVVGYDARRGTILVRDSNYRAVGELMADKGLEHYRPTGPRGMVMVPAEEAARLEGIVLPDAELYDLQYDLLRALDRYDRPAAAAAHERMREIDPTHRLTLLARRALAGFDADQLSSRHACEQLTHKYPECDVWLYAFWYALRGTAPRAERLEFLAKVLGRHDADPIFRLHLADELSEDARTHDESLRLLRSVMRTRPMEARAYFLRGTILWSRRRFDEAYRSFFTAACLADKDEEYSRAYFSAARRVKRVDEALAFLVSRFRRFGAKSAFPGRTLFLSYAALDRMDEAAAVLEESLRLRPDDGMLLIFAADAEARNGRFDLADEYLRRSEGKSHPANRLRVSAENASNRGDPAAALAAWRELLSLEPQSHDAVIEITRLTGELEGTEPAKAFLAGVVERFPHNIELLQAAADYFRDDSAPEAERLVRRLLDFNPSDPWGRRELAIHLLLQGRYDEAIAELDTAEALDPSNPFAHSLRGQVLERLGRPDEARLAYRRGLEASVDHDASFNGLMRVATTHARRLEALAFVHEQLVKQTIYGDGLLAYAATASRLLEPEEVLAKLRAAWEARPDLWHAWSAIVGQLIDMNRLDEAHEHARRETERFSLVPGSWVDLASVARARGDEDAEVSALEHALEINPSWSIPLRRLCDAYERRGEFDRARAFVEQAVRRRPGDAVLHGYLADLDWRADRRVEAMETLERALRLEPGYDWAWDRLREFGELEDQPERALTAARELARRLPNQARSWLVLARFLTDESDREERLAALDRAIALNPRAVEAYVQRSKLACETGDFDGAEAACSVPVFGTDMPPELTGQLAEVSLARGNVEEALKMLERLAEEHPDHWNAWSRLAELCDGQVDRGTLHAKAAEGMIRQAPQSAWAWRHLAEARRDLADLPGAEEAFRKSLELDPNQEYTATALCDLAIDAERFDDAERWVAHAMKRDPSPYVLARHVRVLVATGRGDRAIDTFERLSRMEAHNDWPIDSSFELLKVPATVEALLAAVERAADDPESRTAMFIRYAELQNERGEHERGRETMARAISGHPNEAVLHGYHAEFCWRTDLRADALEALERALRIDYDYDWAWNRLRRFANAERQPERLAAAAREVPIRLPEQAQSWLIVARQLEGDETREERRAAIDRAIALNPQCIDAYVLRSRLCCEAGELDQAEAACTPSAFGEHRPPELIGQQAEVRLARDDVEGAFEVLDRLTEQHPDYWAGWHRIAELCDDNAELADRHAKAADELVRLTPQDPRAWRHVAEACREKKDLAGAETAFLKSLECAPDYEYSANVLCDLALASDRPDDALRWVMHAMQHHPSAYALARHVRVMVDRNRHAEAIQSFERLSVMDAPTDWPITSTTEMLKQPETRDAFLTALEGVVDDPNVHPAVFASYVQLQAERDGWDACRRLLDRSVERREHWLRGARVLLDKYGDRRIREPAAEFVRTHAELLRSDNAAWTEANFALYKAGLYREALEWAAEWRSREGLEPWMMFDIGRTLAAFERYAEAAEVHEQAIALPADASTPAHRLCAAAAQAATGRWESVDEYLEGIEADGLLDEDKIVLEMMLAYNRARPRGGKPGWWAALQARRKLRKALRAHETEIRRVESLDRLDRALMQRLREAQGRTSVFDW